MQGVNEAIVFLLRTTNLTREDLREMLPKQFLEIYAEAQYQQELEDYGAAHNAAAILAAIETFRSCMGKNPRAYKPRDFVGDPPMKGHAKRTAGIDEMVRLAGLRGLKIPRGKFSEIEMEG